MADNLHRRNTATLGTSNCYFGGKSNIVSLGLASLVATHLLWFDPDRYEGKDIRAR
jgi:hypothetical protein